MSVNCVDQCCLLKIDQTNKCQLCQSMLFVKNRSVKCELRPREKDLKRGHIRLTKTLNIKLCNQCYLKNINKTLIGWDEIDALDGLL